MSLWVLFVPRFESRIALKKHIQSEFDNVTCCDFRPHLFSRKAKIFLELLVCRVENFCVDLAVIEAVDLENSMVIG